MAVPFLYIERKVLRSILAFGVISLCMEKFHDVRNNTLASR